MVIQVSSVGIWSFCGCCSCDRRRWGPNIDDGDHVFLPELFLPAADFATCTRGAKRKSCASCRAAALTASAGRRGSTRWGPSCPSRLMTNSFCLNLYNKSPHSASARLASARALHQNPMRSDKCLSEFFDSFVLLRLAPDFIDEGRFEFLRGC